eukprot:GFUD01013587.1.p1 GENE.GFUD01013587.1~~GFUD01013587.1.p1  ORF type:complete len:273 (+),score=52.67 GFUD01013587.1:196-1014(+)
MRLRNLVILVTTFQALFDITGIIVTISCPPCRGVLQLEDVTYDSATEFEDASWTLQSKIYKDYSHIKSSHYSIYVLPHIFSGVVPRMVDGFKCIMADQMVLEYLGDWEKLVGSMKDDPREHIILSLSEAYLKQPKKMMKIEEKLDEALAMRRDFCTNKEEGIIILELVAMAANAVSALLILAISACNKLPRLHIPWMIFSAFEITGNVCVTVAFLIYPGLPYLICMISMTKVMWLKWVWAKTVRRQMHQQIDEHDKFEALNLKLIISRETGI